MENNFKNIMVVDDDYTIRKKLETILSKNGYFVKTFETGNDALNEIENNDSYNLILLDVTMDGINGFETAVSIKNKTRNIDIPIIFITGNTESEDKKKGFDAGCVDYITKPFDNNEVLLRVKLHLELALRREMTQNYAKDLEFKVKERTSEISQTRKALIISLAKLAESRDPETGEHILRTQEYSKALSKEIAKLDKYKDIIDSSFIEMMYDCSPLHDIGKVGIPDNVLLKPDKLTENEFDIMKSHCFIGKKTLESGTEILKNSVFLNFAAEIAYSHHEKYDGSGYPRRISGENIPIQGRIMALSDVYDALISKRVYKKAWSHEEALDYIISQSGKHFDPIIVETFKRIEDKILFIREKYKDKDNE